MTTPIYDFVKKYSQSQSVRLHMPGHKGEGVLGCEGYDITEIHGADSLFEAEGIIAESEKNLSYIYNSRASFYSTEGSSLCIRAMLYTALQHAKKGQRKVLAGRNAHKSFLSALALCDVEADWLYGDDIYSCNITSKMLEEEISKDDYFAVYITNPDYLGNMVDVKTLADVCHRHNIPLIVDNAHGAYLKFTGNHPVDRGADMCCDSAHKTLPCLTGSAYLHVSKTALCPYENDIKRAMSLFASTSPSYLVLASMDAANSIMSEGFEERVRRTGFAADELKTRLSHLGVDFSGREKFKINIKPKSIGYTGYELCDMMEKEGMYPEFCDKDNLVLMFSVNTSDGDFKRIYEFFRDLEKRSPDNTSAPKAVMLERAMSVRQAFFSKQRCVAVDDAVGCVCASPAVSCPPAIPVAVCGEIITKEAVSCFRYYGVNEICIVE